MLEVRVSRNEIKDVKGSNAAFLANRMSLEKTPRSRGGSSVRD
jgi:hypothetical protein